MTAHKLSAMFILLGAVSLSAGLPVLTAPPAPLRVVKAAAPEKGNGADIGFDAVNKTFFFGSKRFVFRNNATFSYLAGSREIMSGYFFVSTPFNGWQPNRNSAVVKEYKGGQMCILEVVSDPKTQSVTWKGVVPFHKKDQLERILRNWELKVSLTPEKKLDIHYRFETPDGKKFKDCGIFLNCPGIVREERTYDKKRRNWGSYGVSRLVAENPLNTITVTPLTPNYIHPFKNGSYRYSPQNLDWHYVIDPGKVAGKAVFIPGGVDFYALDNLRMPERTGRNLFLNPYFAQGTLYYWSHGQGFAKGMSNDNVLTSKTAKFGKYSMPAAGLFYLNTVPAEAGDYVLSFFAKGNGSAYIQVSDEINWYNNLKSGTITLKSKDWKRYEFPFRFRKRGAINIMFRPSSAPGTQAYIDGFQLETGRKASPFEAPRITAGLVSPDGLNFFEDGKKADCSLEFSTLSKKPVSGTAEVTVTNFFKEEIFRKTVPFSVKDGEYPRHALNIGVVPQGIYIVKVTYAVSGVKRKRSEYFRFAVMPFLENRHLTAKMYSMTYAGGHGGMRTASEKQLRRYQQVGVGAFGHACPMSPEALNLYRKYRVIPFDVSCTGRAGAPRYRMKYPKLKIPDGRTYFHVRDPWIPHWSNKDTIMPDYRLTGGWNEEYRKKFKAACIEQLKKTPGLKAYNIGSEWPMEIKSDPHYPDLVETFCEAVKEVYPDAWAYEAGDCNMDVTGGVAQLDYLLSCWDKRKFKPDVLGCHFYTKDVTQVYSNLKAFVSTAAKHGYDKTPLAFPEGMHFYPYEIPEWGRLMVEWGGRGWGGGTLSYDLGWTEMLSTAYYMRCYLVFLTIFDRAWCVTSSANYINSFNMDLSLTPRGIQKIVNTLGIKLGNPRKFVGDFTFAPETRCLVWIDETGAPLAAVWNESPAQQTGRSEAPFAEMAYRGARYFDMMGVERKPEKDGRFPVSAFPVLIQGRAGDTAAFVKALANAKMDNGGKLPFHVSSEILPDNRLKLTFVTDLHRPVSGMIEAGGKQYPLQLVKDRPQNLLLPLKTKLSAGRINILDLPFVCKADGKQVPGRISEQVITAKKFTGDWSRIPAIPMTNLCIESKTEKRTGPKDFSASFQVAWDEKNLYLRVMVKDDRLKFSDLPGNRYNWDCVQVYFDTRCSARKFGRTVYDEDDYDYTLMPTKDGQHCEVFRALSPDMQLTLGIAAPKNNEIANGIPVKFTRTDDGCIYEAAFPAWSILPARLERGYNLGFALYAADRDAGPKIKQAYSLAVEPGKSPYMKPHLWPLLVLGD